VETLSPKIQVLVLCIALQDSVKKITKSVFPRASFILMTLQFLLTRTVNLLKNAHHTREFTWRKPTK
jgi:hypothetical protein